MNKGVKNSEATQFKSGAEAAENGRKGGIASGVTRRRKKTLKEIADAIGAKDAPLAVIENLIKQGVADADEEVTGDIAVLYAQYGKAWSGNTRAATYIAEVKGERIQRIESVNIDQSLEAMDGYFDRQERTSEETPED